MKNALFISIFIALAAVHLVACGAPAQAAEEPPSMEPSETSEPVASSPTDAQVEPAEPTASPQPEYSAFCQGPAAAGCEAPEVRMIDPKYCVDKVPYVIISVPPGTTYKSSDLDLYCVEQMHNDGNLRITCHSLSGKDAWSYNIVLCNSACSVPALQMETGQCPQGYGYDPTNSCCAAPAPASSDGCSTFKVDLRVCYGE